MLYHSGNSLAPDKAIASLGVLRSIPTGILSLPDPSTRPHAPATPLARRGVDCGGGAAEGAEQGALLRSWPLPPTAAAAAPSFSFPPPGLPPAPDRCPGSEPLSEGDEGEPAAAEARAVAAAASRRACRCRSALATMGRAARRLGDSSCAGDAPASALLVSGRRAGELLAKAARLVGDAALRAGAAVLDGSTALALWNSDHRCAAASEKQGLNKLGAKAKCQACEDSCDPMDCSI